MPGWWARNTCRRSIVMLRSPSASRRQFLLWSAASAASLVAASAPAGPWARVAPALAQGPGAPATVDAAPSQTMQGFGASGAWWPNDLVHFRPEVQQTVADMLFGPRGIALSAYRYNIGGGGLDVTIPARGPETMLVSPGVYDWSRDPGGRLFLRARGRARCADPGRVREQRPAGLDDQRAPLRRLAPGGRRGRLRALPRGRRHPLPRRRRHHPLLRQPDERAEQHVRPRRPGGHGRPARAAPDL